MTRQSLNGAWQLRQAGSNEWLPAPVPGGVHTDLMAAGRIADPFVGDEELRVQWVAEADWEYRRTFRVDAAVAAEERVALVFDGLDTLADVRLNGELLGSADNMFRTWRWDVTGRLAAGDNEVAVLFRSAVRRGAELNAVRPLDRPKETLPGGPYLRKAPCHFGWDWGPKLPNVGIWQDVRIEGWSVARLADVRIRAGGRSRTRPSEPARQGRGRTDGRLRAPRPIEARLRVVHPDGRTDAVQAAIPAGAVGRQPRLEIAEPASCGGPTGWAASRSTGSKSSWPAATGRSTSARTRSACERSSFGASRTNGASRSPSSSTACPSSPRAPTGSRPTRSQPASAEQLERLLGAAAAANHNMLRVWGGGYYEDERFYDLCDRYGILVWQDFMFACSVYPLTDDAVPGQRARSRSASRCARLRHRACLALWCGNNEMEQGWVNWGGTGPDNRGPARGLPCVSSTDPLPAWVAAQDPATPYWPSSPSSGRPFAEPNGRQRGDEHYWMSGTALRRSPPTATVYRFMSEFGFQSLPRRRRSPHSRPIRPTRTWARP